MPRNNQFEKLPSLDFPHVDGLCTVYNDDWIVLVASGNRRAYIANQTGIVEGIWEEIARPKRNHFGGGLVVMLGQLVLFGKLLFK